MADLPSDKEFLEFIIKALVDEPDKVEVIRSVDEMGVLLTLKVGQGDMGRIIGRAGSTARAIRTLTRLVGLRHNARVNLKIEEPEGGARPQPASDTNVSTDSSSSDLDDSEKVMDDLDDLENI